MSTSKNNLNQMALANMAFSHSPYSNKKIGASVLLSNGKSYSGCNIENASYGGTVCAERVAIWKAYSENLSEVKIQEVVVASNEASPWPPCGFCRQVMAEFCTPETTVRLINPAGLEIVFIFKNLFPEAFKPEHLNK
ncbi:MAG: cytidine deaminase [Bdellovibrionales bacterium RIFCSPHIGHO2_01_FULL_40_29]|nr:MAG: cytidine deaminase [Bdellovibrionales bacterium RIFCSPHIGHO2_01_FULL_40_29]OFZ32674.1 MAG: cytidine deaminase [Bdellovibrionales bacterium RIFCSPHIGHO2_02_FULL_40_15]